VMHALSLCSFEWLISLLLLFTRRRSHRSLGVTLFAFVFGDIPWRCNSIPVLYEHIKSNDVNFPQKIKISDELKDLITQMLEKDPVKRPSLEAVKVSGYNY
jgi:[calcium/calmodulin-dependent protein kinase] kinase